MFFKFEIIVPDSTNINEAKDVQMLSYVLVHFSKKEKGEIINSESVTKSTKRL